jgi:hypothetical protein
MQDRESPEIAFAPGGMFSPKDSAEIGAPPKTFRQYRRYPAVG